MTKDNNVRHVVLLVLLAWVCVGVQAQTALAVAVETTYAGAEVQLNGTDQWITLPDGSNTPLGAGDTVRTDLFGRARISFDDSTMLVLSGTTFTLDEYTATDDRAVVRATVEGISIHNIADTVTFDLQAAEMSIHTIGADFAVWSRPNLPHTITVADGSLSVTVDDETWDVGAGEGYHSSRGDEHVIAIDEPYNQAYIIGELEGCVETVQTLNEEPGVLVRTGAGTGYQRRGYLDNGTEIPLLAKTFSGYWTRIQYGNGFGWVITDAVRTDCDLEILPDDTPEEDFTRATNPDQQELDMLRPFYGNPLLDSWFYQIIEE